MQSEISFEQSSLSCTHVTLLQKVLCSCSAEVCQSREPEGYQLPGLPIHFHLWVALWSKKLRNICLSPVIFQRLEPQQGSGFMQWQLNGEGRDSSDVLSRQHLLSLKYLDCGICRLSQLILTHGAPWSLHLFIHENRQNCGQNQIARKWQKQDSDPSCLMLRAWLYSQYAMMPPFAAVLYVSFC